MRTWPPARWFAQQLGDRKARAASWQTAPGGEVPESLLRPSCLLPGTLIREIVRKKPLAALIVVRERDMMRQIKRQAG
jgi:hypothetical protein